MKIKNRINFALNIFNRFTYFIDLFVLSYFLSKLNSIDNRSSTDTFLYYGLIVALIILSFKYIRSIYFVIKSKMDREVYLLNNRVVAIAGKQRAGKSSLGVYFSSYSRSVYSNIPMKSRNKFAKKLTTDILTLNRSIEDGSVLIIDEANLFYNNTMSFEDKKLYGQAILCQCVGHFFDGNILYIATDIDRMPKIIRQEWSTKLQVLKSRSYHYSFIGDSLLKLIYFIVNKETLKYTGLRLWDCQQYEKILEEQYISILGKSEKDNKFSPCITFASYQGIGMVDYDDRYMKAYYNSRPVNNDTFWDSLQLSVDDFKTLYDSLLSNYITQLDKNDNITKNIKIRGE